MSERLQKFIRFCLVGVVNTGVDFTVFIVLSNLGIPLIVAQCVSYSCGVLNSFNMNRKWTFRARGQSPVHLIKFLTLNLCTLALTYGLLVFFHHYLGWPILVSKLIATGVSVIMNFTGSRLLIFA